MPRYDFYCMKCRKEMELLIKLSEYSPDNTPCPKCKRPLRRVFNDAPNFSIPGHCTYDGVTKISNSHASKGQKEELAKPLTLEHDDGSITRIGAKKDIENDG